MKNGVEGKKGNPQGKHQVANINIIEGRGEGWVGMIHWELTSIYA